MTARWVDRLHVERGIRRRFRNAVNKGLWKIPTPAPTPAEFWAEICQSYFDCNRVNNWNHGPIGTAGSSMVLRILRATNWSGAPLT